MYTNILQHNDLVSIDSATVNALTLHTANCWFQVNPSKNSGQEVERVTVVLKRVRTGKAFSRSKKSVGSSVEPLNRAPKDQDTCLIHLKRGELSRWWA